MAWSVLGGPREVTGGPWTSLRGSLRVLGGPSGSPREDPVGLGRAWEGPKTDDVFSERLGRVLGGSWGRFGALRRSSGRSWEVQMISLIIMMF